MDKVTFRRLLVETHEDMMSLSVSKGEEYANSSSSQTANFERQSADLGIPPEAVLLVYLNKHMDSIRYYVKKLSAGEEYIMSEPIEGRIKDAILYLHLLLALVKDK